MKQSNVYMVFAVASLLLSFITTGQSLILMSVMFSCTSAILKKLEQIEE